MNTNDLAAIVQAIAEALRTERETLFHELTQMIREDDHARTIDAKVTALGLVEGAAHIAAAVADGLVSED
jgi:hypothetical protein